MIKLAEEIINGKRLRRGDDLSFFETCDLEQLCSGADMIRQKLCGDKVDLCSIINGKSGRCSENCKFCAQSGCSKTGIDEYDFLDEETILAECKHNEQNGVHRFSIVTAGRTLSDSDFEKALSAYRRMKNECKIELCASHGLLTEEQFKRLHDTGIRRYHANIETSRRFFPCICTTHTYDDKIACIKRAQSAGLEVCSGGIIGMGETFADRIDMAVSLSELVIVSVPINALRPVKGTPFQDIPPITEDEILRTAAMFRYILPTANIRLAAGRNMMRDSGKRAFHSGVNATITGDMLTTSGNNTKQDIAMLKEQGFEV